MKFCGLNCRHAAFPKAGSVDGSGSCRTFVALYCKLKKWLVHKNSPCADWTEKGARAKTGRRKK